MTRDEMRALKELKRLLIEEIKEINEKGKIESSEIHPLYEVIDMVKDISTVCAMEEYGDQPNYEEPEYSYTRGYSGRMMPRYSYDGYPYDNGMSGARHRDSMGRYASTGYSGHMGNGDMIDQLQQMLDSGSLSKESHIAIKEAMKNISEGR